METPYKSTDDSVKILLNVPVDGCSEANFAQSPVFEQQQLDVPSMRKLVQRYMRHANGRKTKWGANFHIQNQVIPLISVPGAAFVRLYLVATPETNDPDPDNSNRADKVFMFMTVTNAQNEILTSQTLEVNNLVFMAECCGNPPGNTRFDNDPFFTTNP